MEIKCKQSDWVSSGHLESGGHHEVFLFQTQLFALEEVVVGVEDLGDVLGHVAVEHGLDVVAVVDCRRRRVEQNV